MKKVLSLILIFALCFSLTGCIKIEVKSPEKEDSLKPAKTESTKATATSVTTAKPESTKTTIGTKPTVATDGTKATAATTPAATGSTISTKATGESKDYTVSDAELEKKKDVVIAEVGDQTLTNEQLQVYFWMAAREYVNQYNAALSYGQNVELGFDPAKPLDEQIHDSKTGETWQQFFLETALSQWQNYATVVQLSKDAGYELSQEIKDYLDTYDEEMSAAALSAGFKDVEALIDAQISKGSSAAAHYHMFLLEYTALGFLETRDDEMKPTEQELEDYYKAHEAELKEIGCGKDAGKYYDVRHIFITVEGTMGQLEDGTYGYTDAQWEECRARAQKMLDDFLTNDPTEEKFAALAKEHSEDPGSASNGGLYSYLTKDYGFIKEFEDWYVDESRKPGDTGIVKNTGSSKVGYHIMYFSDCTEIWKDEVEGLVVEEKMTKLLDDAKVKYPITVEYKKIALGGADLTTD